MAISWIAALKLVPWGDVIEAAPHVLKAAKGLLRRSDGDSKAEPKPVSQLHGLLSRGMTRLPSPWPRSPCCKSALRN